MRIQIYSGQSGALLGAGQKTHSKSGVFCAGQKAELLTELENVERLKKRSPAAQRRFHVWKACFFILRICTIRLRDCPIRRLTRWSFSSSKPFCGFVRQAAEIAANLSAEYGLEDFVFRNTDEAFDLLKADKGEGFLWRTGFRTSCLPRAGTRRRQTPRLRARKTKSDSQPQSKLISKRRRGEEAALEEARAKSCVLLLRPFAEDFSYNSSLAGRLDLTLAKARLAYATNAVKPSVSGDKLRLKELTNPEMAEKLGLRGAAFTPVSIEADRGVTLITGANMGGKKRGVEDRRAQRASCACGLFSSTRRRRQCRFSGLLKF